MKYPIPVRVRYRVAQGLSHLRPARPITAGQRALVNDILSEAQRPVFFSMPAADQHHHCCVAERLLEDGWTDPELLQAAMLHDAGKFADGDRPSVLARAITVLARALVPDVFDRMSAEPRRWNRGLRLIAQHEPRGAEIAGKCGSSARVQELIARHGSPGVNGDVQLAALQNADSAC